MPILASSGTKDFCSAISLAHAEARRWLGATYPNPAVGAVALDAAGRVLAAGAHKRAGQPHAEADLLENCRKLGVADKIHTVCVTLEPCNHYGRTPPCTEALIAAGVKRVVAGTRDPTPHVKGGGFERLREAGIEVVNGIGEEACRQLIAAYTYRVVTGRPWITVKRAFNADGSMIPAAGQTTFTSPASLTFAHRLRKRCDAILTGSGTVLADNPAFTVRHVPDFSGKRRVLAILDRRGRVTQNYLEAASQRGFEPVIYTDIVAALDDLAKRGMCDVLVEAGPALSQAMLEGGHWNQAIAIHTGSPDRVETSFNAGLPPPFDPGLWDWENALPKESDALIERK